MRGSRSHAVLAARGLAILIGLGIGLYLVADGIHVLWPQLAHALTQSEAQGVSQSYCWMVSVSGRRFFCVWQLLLSALG